MKNLSPRGLKEMKKGNKIEDLKKKFEVRNAA